jgi:uncharacterized DUF497 family protein
MISDELIEQIEGFEWDEGNLQKNFHKHGVTQRESEEVFTMQPLILAEDLVHSLDEPRYLALGRTVQGRKLLQVFTIRRKKIRIISARDMNKKEKQYYARA